jgi:hypothetical protein
MTPLIGTPKQVEWGAHVRDGMVARWGPMPEIADANFWLDNRSAATPEALHLAARAYEAERDANFDSPFTDRFPYHDRTEALPVLEALCRMASTIGVVVLDLETTGLERSDRIVEIAAVRWPSQEILIDTLIRPPAGMVAAEVTGITAEQLAEAPSFGELPPDRFGWAASSHLVSWNARFDMPVLRREIAAVEGWATPPIRATCAMRLGAAWLGLDGWPGLAEFQARVGLKPHEDAHRAMADVLATCDVLDLMVRSLGRG